MLARLTAYILLLSAMMSSAEGQRRAAGNFYTYDLSGSKRTNDDGDFRQSWATFLFRGAWTKGVIVTANNLELKNDSFFMNLDKMSQSLWVTSDYNRYVEIDKKEFKSVTFYLGDSSFVFEHVYYIDNRHLFQVIVPSGKKYALFKLTVPVLRKKELPNGIMYFTYIDVCRYYLLFPNKDYRKIRSLTRKSIMKIFTLLPEKDKVEDFLLAQGDNSSGGESYLKNLVAYLNN
jgi:hypothetical protein